MDKYMSFDDEFIEPETVEFHDWSSIPLAQNLIDEPEKIREEYFIRVSLGSEMPLGLHQSVYNR